jgi:hypothetical protein
MKGLQEMLHLSSKTDTGDYVKVEGVLTVRKRSLLTYMDIGSDLVDDAEDAILNRKVVLQLVSCEEVDPGETQTLALARAIRDDVVPACISSVL